MQILTLAVDPHRPFGNAQHTFDARHRRQPGPLQQGDGVKDRFRVEDPTAGLIALAAVKVAAPALVFRQAKGGETGCWGMAMGVLPAGSGAVFRRGSSSRARSIFPWVADTWRRSPPQRCHQSANA